jgi:putative transposase
MHHVWSTDSTYIRLREGFISLVAGRDWFSRYVLSWAVLITRDVGFCLEALEQALGVAHPEIFNSDQGAQFTSLDFTGRLEAAGAQSPHRRAWTGAGQRLCRATVADCEICGGLPERL